MASGAVQGRADALAARRIEFKWVAAGGDARHAAGRGPGRAGAGSAEARGARGADNAAGAAVGRVGRDVDAGAAVGQPGGAEALATGWILDVWGWAGVGAGSDAYADANRANAARARSTFSAGDTTAAAVEGIGERVDADAAAIDQASLATALTSSRNTAVERSEPAPEARGETTQERAAIRAGCKGANDGIELTLIHGEPSS